MSKTDHTIIALFDFDGTLTYKSTSLAFFKFLDRKRFYAIMPLLFPVLILYVCRLISVDTLNKCICQLVLKGKSKEEVIEAGKEFALKKMPHLVRPEGMQKLQEHQKMGHYCILATAGFDIYVKPWSELHHFNSVVCTELDCNQNNKLTGKLNGITCYGVEKLSKVKKVIPPNRGEVFAYGDSAGDKEMLLFADYSFYQSFKSNLKMPHEGHKNSH